MSDLDGLHGIFPDSIRWNAEDGFLAVSRFNGETGERSLQEVELGSKLAIFAMDLATRERGYGLIKIGVYDMLLTPVGSPPPPWPGDAAEYKAALGCWLWSPAFDELRLETNSALFRNAIADVWARCRHEPLAVEGQMPVISFVDRNPVFIKAVGKTFFAPVIRVVGWVERTIIPNWAARPPTVPLPAALPVLPAATVSTMPPPPSAMSAVVEPPAAAEPIRANRRRQAKLGAADQPKDPNDDLPWTA